MNTLLRKFFILAAVLLCCTALANAYDAQIDGIYYNFDKANGTATVTSGDSKYEGDITIPAKVTYESKEYIVTSIGAAAFYENYALASITIPSGVTSIGDNSFAECSNLASVTFAEGSKLESIGAGAFALSDALASITIPSGVTSIGDNAFYNCSNLATVTFAEGSKLESIGAAAFYNCCANLTSIVIPNSVKTIGDSAFAECNKLASVTFEEGSKLESIGASAFYNCWKNLTSIAIPNSVKTIGDRAFAECNKLASVTFAEGSKLESIGAGAFANSYALASITIPNSVTSIGDNSFAECSNLASVTFAEGSKLESIGAAAFYRCLNLASITIPSSVKIIGDRAFAECDKLASITIPSSVTSIGDRAFAECNALASVTFEEGSKLESIGASAFYQNFALASITIPSSVTSIGDNAFNDCRKLATVTFEEGSKLESIGAAAFYRCLNLASITIPSSVTSIGASAFYWCLNLASITIPSGVMSIGDSSFYSCNVLASVTFEEGSKLESIGAGAFAKSYALASITIPNSVTSIGMSAFYNCSGLESITVQWTEAEKIPDISGKDVFEGITQSDVMLHVPLATKTLYKGTNVWKEFKLNEEIGILIVKADDSRIKQKFPDVSDFSIDESNNDIKNIVVSGDVDAVSSITYTRDFTNVAGKWQAWFVPFEAPVSVLNEASIDVAEIAGILLDDEGETIVAFKKIEGDSKKMHANTPYVVRMGNDATTIATLVFENTNLKETAESEYYAMSMYDKFTFTGNYESKHVADSYTLNTEGEFQQMDENVNLKPMRFSLSITPRDDSPYISQSNPKAVIRYMVLGDDGTLQPIDEDGRTGIKPATTPANSFKRSQQPMRIYDMHGRKVNRIQSKQVYIIDGKTYTAR